MRRIIIALLVLFIVVPSVACAVEKKVFEEAFGDTKGCFVLYNITDNTTERFDPERCKVRQSPCSTFKIMNSLIALQTGVHKDENSKLKWNGKPQPIKEWERDHTMKTAMKYSCVWYYKQTAAKIGEKRMQYYLDKVGYGNRDISAGLTTFWLHSSLKISPDEQVNFLTKLYRNQLPFDKKATDTVKRLIVQKQTTNFEFSGKTGSAWVNGKYEMGWFVGHVKKDKKEYVFGCNIEGTGCQGFKAKGITEKVLKGAGLWE